MMTRIATAQARAILLILANSKKYPVRQAGDDIESKFSVAMRAAFAVARKRLPNVDAAVKSLQSALGQTLPALVSKGLEAGGKATVLRLKVAESFRSAANKLTMQFNADNPRAVKWAKDHAAELIDGIGKTTRERLEAAIAAHQVGDTSDKDYSSALDDAVGDEARAETIARTEAMTVVHRGQREAWDQAIDDGLLSGDEKRVWIVTPDDLLCPICEPLDGVEANLDGEYESDEGETFDGPPAHPNCRCTEGLA
jgi:hypothetical protein